MIDTLLTYDIQIQKVFAPEHGFRGRIDAGEKVADDKDVKTGLPIISLYGKNKKPSADQLKDIDLVLFDIQDVGVRFYTYISTLSLVMEACAELTFLLSFWIVPIRTDIILMALFLNQITVPLWGCMKYP